MSCRGLFLVLAAAGLLWLSLPAFSETAEDAWVASNKHTGELAKSGHLQEAFKNAQKVLAQARAVWGFKNLNTAKAMNNLANLYVQADKLDSAEELYLKSLEIEKESGSSGETIGGTLFNLAVIHKARGDLEGANRLLDEVQERTAAGPGAKKN